MTPDERRGAPVSAEARPPAAGPPFLAVCGSRKPAPGISRPSAGLDLRDLDLPHFDGRPPEAYGSADLERARAQVLRSQVVVLSVPAYWQGPAGVVKNFLDLVGGPAYDAPPDQAPPLAGKVVALLVVGADRGSGHSALGAMRLTLAAMGAWTAPRAAVVGDLREVRSTAVLLASLKEFGRYVAGIGAVQAPIAAIRPAFAPVPGPSVGAGR